MKDELLQLNVLLQLKSELHFYFHKLFQGLAINLKLLCCIYAYLIPSGIGLVLVWAAVAAYHGWTGWPKQQAFIFHSSGGWQVQGMVSAQGSLVGCRPPTSRILTQQGDGSGGSLGSLL